MICTITVQNPLNSPTYFDISTEDFAPVFTGTKTVEGTFDPVYGGPIFIQDFGHPTCGFYEERRRCGNLKNHISDYDQITVDSNYNLSNLGGQSNS